jgi:2-polyprenyl-3-methyl-5-hydroxy-6-metoxy-1,4-benzoquinol methylase
MSEIKKYIPTAWEDVNCLICGSSERDLYENFGCDLQYHYQKCRNCSLIYLSPRPKYDAAFIEAAYGNYYQFNETLTYNDETYVKESSVRLFKEEIENILKYETTRNNVLDIGAAMGTFLYAAKPHYKKCVGLDMSRQMANFVATNLGVEMHVVQFEEFEHPEKFSLIHMSHVLEHIPNPNQWLQKAKQLLDANGILVINVPNKFSLSNLLQHLWVKLRLKRQFNSSWNNAYTRTPDHLFDPNVKSMLYLIEKNNFKIIDYFSYSRKDPASNKSFLSKLLNRKYHMGSNLSFLVKAK